MDPTSFSNSSSSLFRHCDELSLVNHTSISNAVILFKQNRQIEALKLTFGYTSSQLPPAINNRLQSVLIILV